MLRLGHFIEAGHDIPFFVLQQLNPQNCIEKQRLWLLSPMGPCTTVLPSLPLRYTLTGILEPLHVPAVFKVYLQAAPRGKKEEPESISVITGAFTPVRPTCRTCCSSIKLQLWYSQVWLFRVAGNGQGKAGLWMINTEETVPITVVIDQVIPVPVQQTKQVPNDIQKLIRKLGLWQPRPTWPLLSHTSRQLTHWNINCRTRSFRLSDPS